MLEAERPEADRERRRETSWSAVCSHAPPRGHPAIFSHGFCLLRPVRGRCADRMGALPGIRAGD
eukprot:5972869-Prymnesium_polylepis.1